ncbi:MAG: FG-GAP repeat protein [Phycisphaerae bacterium]|nr:FG-GAP repeat protein [Phycisphaerae bacterium]
MNRMTSLVVKAIACAVMMAVTVHAGDVPMPPAPPVIHEEVILLPQPAQNEPRFGLAVAVTGSTVLVGSPRDGDDGTDDGAVQGFGDSKRGWRRVQRLQSTDPAWEDRFGQSVAASGSRVIVGRDRADDGAPNAGAAVVFKRAGYHYRKEADLVPPDPGADDGFGCAVAIDGAAAIVGSSRDDDAGLDSGSAYAWALRGTSWELTAKLVAPDAASADWFGRAVAVDGNFIVVGAYGDDDRGEKSGAAYVFRRDGGEWLLDVKLVPEDLREGDWFGFSVAVHGDTIAIGAPRDSGAGESAGCVRLFRRGTGGVWTPEATLRPPMGTTTAWFGYAVALDTERLIIGAPGTDNGGEATGSAAVFACVDGTWTQRAELAPQSPVAGALFGSAVAVDGGLVAIGKQYDEDTEISSGKAWVFRLSGKPRKADASATSRARQINATVARRHAPSTAGVALCRDILGVTRPNDAVPLGNGRARDEGRLDSVGVGVMLREFDSELPHHAPGTPFAVQLHREIEMIEQRLALLGESRRGRSLTAHQLSSLPEDPRIADAATCHGHSVNAREFEHGEDVFDLPDIARTENDAVRLPCDEITQKLPFRRPEILLLHRAAMHGRPCVSEVVRSVEDAFKVSGHRRRVIERPP